LEPLQPSAARLLLRAGCALLRPLTEERTSTMLELLDLIAGGIFRLLPEWLKILSARREAGGRDPSSSTANWSTCTAW
jgi:hypothetical protein